MYKPYRRENSHGERPPNQYSTQFVIFVLYSIITVIGLVFLILAFSADDWAGLTFAAVLMGMALAPLVAKVQTHSHRR